MPYYNGIYYTQEEYDSMFSPREQELGGLIPAGGETTYPTLTGETAVSEGLTQAGGLMADYTPSPYPSYVPSQTAAPTQQNYMNYTPNQPMAQVTTPDYQLNTSTPTWGAWTPQQTAGYGTTNTNVQASPWNYQTVIPDAQAAGYQFQNTGTSTPWQSWTPQTGLTYGTAPTDATAAGFNWQNTALGMQGVTNPFSAYGGANPTYQKLGTTPTYAGLMGGDYNALQGALTLPGMLSAGTAYREGQTNLANQMGGQGLYGSSIMANQARTALDTPYMNALATNAANAAATRYGMQATDLQNRNQFGLNIYGQQMGENQFANQMGYNTWGQRLSENLSGQQMGLEAQQSNQSAYQYLQNLLSQQGLAQNTAGLNYAQLQTGVNQQNVANTLQQTQLLNALRSGDYQQLQSLLSQQGLAQNSQNLAGTQMGLQQSLAGNTANLDYANLLTGVNQQNTANALAQSQQANQLGLNYSQFQTQTASDSANRQLQQQQALNALLSGDMQTYNAIMSQQGLAQNAFNQNTYNQQMAQNQQMNAYNLESSQLGMQQNQNLYQAGVSDAARQQEYDLAAQQWQQQQAEAQRQWQNQQALEQFQYQLASGQYTNEQQQQMINNYLALAGRGQVTAGQNAATNINTANMDAASQASLWNGLISAGMTAAQIYFMFPGLTGGS